MGGDDRGHPRADGRVGETGPRTPGQGGDRKIPEGHSGDDEPAGRGADPARAATQRSRLPAGVVRIPADRGEIEGSGEGKIRRPGPGPGRVRRVPARAAGHDAPSHGRRPRGPAEHDPEAGQRRGRGARISVSARSGPSRGPPDSGPARFHRTPRRTRPLAGAAGQSLHHARHGQPRLAAPVRSRTRGDAERFWPPRRQADPP